MCDYDDMGDYHHLASRSVKRTRTPHECSSCLRTIPAGSSMHRWSGICEGSFTDDYVCQTCDWAEKQQDHTATHLCYGWAWSESYDAGELFDGVRYDYIASALARGETPTADGAVAAVRAHLLAEAGDDADARASAASWSWPTVVA